MSVLTESAAWRALTTLAEADPATTTSARFERDPGRAARYSAEACGLYLDYSKQRFGDDALVALLALAEQQQMPGWIARMFAGEAINATEGRAVLVHQGVGRAAWRLPRHLQETSMTPVDTVQQLYAAFGRGDIPAILSHLADDERRALVISDNRLAEMATWDLDVLKLETDDLRAAGYDLELYTGFAEEDLAKL